MFAFVLLAACSSEFNVTSEPSVDTVEPCELTVTTDPVPGSDTHDYRDPVTFWLSASDPSVSLVAPVAGRTQVYDGGTTLVFTPNEPFEPAQDYTFALSTCAGTAGLGFTTSEVGLLLDDGPESLEQRAWTIDLYNGEYDAGGQLMAIVAAVFTDHLLLGVQEVGEDELEISIAAAIPSAVGMQDPCMRTVDLPVSWDEPHLYADLESLFFPAYGIDITLWDVVAEATFHPDGETLEKIDLRMTTDVRELMSLLSLDDPEDFDAACEVAQFLEMTCGECPSDGAAYCLDIHAREFTGLAVDDPVTPIAREQTCD